MKLRKEHLASLAVVVVCFQVLPPERAIVFSAVLVFLTIRWLPRMDVRGAHAMRVAEQLELPVACDVIALSLDSGISWDRAVGLAARCCPDGLRLQLEIAAGRLAMGAAPDEVWRGMPALESLGEVVERSFRSGAAVSELLAQHADAMRSRERMRRIANVRRLETTILIPLTLVGLPAALLLGVVPTLVSFVLGSNFISLSTGQ